MLFIVKIDSYDGETTGRTQHDNFVDVAALYVVVQVGAKGAGVVDDGYRTAAEAKEAWPEALAPPQ